MDLSYRQLNSFSAEILQTKKDFNLFSSINDQDKSEQFYQNLEELNESFNQMVLLKRDIDEAINLNEKYDEKINTASNIFTDKYQVYFENLIEENAEISKELENLKETMEKKKNVNQSLIESRSQLLKHQTHEFQLNIIKNDQKIIDQIKRAEKVLVNCLEKYSKISENNEDYFLLKYRIFELMLGIKVLEMPNDFGSQWFNIAFINLIDDVLDFEIYSENNPLTSKTKKSHLSQELLDKYRSIFKKRRKMNGNVFKGCLVLNELEDFQIMSNCYLQLLCFIMSKQEIEDAKNQFAIDWIEGSQSSKMATILLPKHYPLCDQSLIKLTSLSGYDDADIKNFKIKKKVFNLSEWIAELTNLYNKNQIKSSEKTQEIKQIIKHLI
ncbi:hypothetical protein BpHYR1_005007 [Brachionus plicatilis]|uniref:Uncharacterized protein n=1 Tax=Brachionus plicatilis TaxID=10195 RepID=A0A3M7QMK3_BRAPC|nr:hypothetical protein BpHYR1_005007 [Brachionus plicatilis]